MPAIWLKLTQFFPAEEDDSDAAEVMPDLVVAKGIVQATDSDIERTGTKKKINFHRFYLNRL